MIIGPKKEERGRQMLRSPFSFPSTLVPFAPFSSLPCRIGCLRALQIDQSSQPAARPVNSPTSITPFCLHVRLKGGEDAFGHRPFLLPPHSFSLPFIPFFLLLCLTVCFFWLLHALATSLPQSFIEGTPPFSLFIWVYRRNIPSPSQFWLKIMVPENYCASVFFGQIYCEKMSNFPTLPLSIPSSPSKTNLLFSFPVLLARNGPYHIHFNPLISMRA